MWQQLLNLQFNCFQFVPKIFIDALVACEEQRDKDKCES